MVFFFTGGRRHYALAVHHHNYVEVYSNMFQELYIFVFKK